MKQRPIQPKRSRFRIDLNPNAREDGDGSSPDRVSGAKISKFDESSVALPKSRQQSKSISKHPQTIKHTGSIQSTSEKKSLSNYEVFNMVGELVANKVINRIDKSDIPKLIGNPKRANNFRGSRMSADFGTNRGGFASSKADRSSSEVTSFWQLKDVPLVSQNYDFLPRVKYDGPLMIRANMSLNDKF